MTGVAWLISVNHHVRIAPWSVCTQNRHFFGTYVSKFTRDHWMHACTSMHTLKTWECHSNDTGNCNPDSKKSWDAVYLNKNRMQSFTNSCFTKKCSQTHVAISFIQSCVSQSGCPFHNQSWYYPVLPANLFICQIRCFFIWVYCVGIIFSFRVNFKKDLKMITSC